MLKTGGKTISMTTDATFPYPDSSIAKKIREIEVIVLLVANQARQ
jgi:hypothetical protein